MYTVSIHVTIYRDGQSVCVCVCFASLSVISRACCIIVLLTLMHHAIATRHAYSNQLHSPNTGPIIPGFILLMLSVLVPKFLL